MMRPKLGFLSALVPKPASLWPEEAALDAYLRQDYPAVLTTIRPPALSGKSWAQSWLGEEFEHGQGVAQDHAEAVKWYRLAAQQGDASAQLNLGLAYLHGQGVEQNHALAHKWLKLAAITHDAEERNNPSTAAKPMMPRQKANANPDGAGLPGSVIGYQ